MRTACFTVWASGFRTLNVEVYPAENFKLDGGVAMFPYIKC